MMTSQPGLIQLGKVQLGALGAGTSTSLLAQLGVVAPTQLTGVVNPKQTTGTG